MSTPNGHDQDAEPPTPTGEEPDPAEYDRDDPTPASHPDPDLEGDQTER